jgi:hypothetical protein
MAFCLPPFFEALNSKKMSNLGPKHCLLFEKCCHFDHSFGTPPIKMVHQGVARWGFALFCEGGLKGAAVPLIAKKILDMWQAKIGLRVT